MEKEFEKVESKEVYVAPACKCIEIIPEGVLCSSDPDGGFDSEGDDFWGEW